MITGLPIFYILEGGLHPVLQFKRVLLPSSKNSKGYPFISLKKKKKNQEGENNKNNFKYGGGGGVLNEDQHCKSTKFGSMCIGTPNVCVSTFSQFHKNQTIKFGIRETMHRLTQSEATPCMLGVKCCYRNLNFSQSKFLHYIMNLVLLWWYNILVVSSFFTSCQS